MQSINAREARKIFSELLDEAQNGAEIAITRRGREIARLVPSPTLGKKEFPDMGAFRDSIQISGAPTSQQVIDARDEERF